jgi:uncharacterized protein YndB with AHSA1/START domain
MEAFIVRKEILLEATAAQVWDALTNPKKTKKYFFNCKVISDWQKGSPIVFKGRMFLIYSIELHGVIEEIEPEKLLKYKLYNTGGESGFSIVTDRLSEETGKTLLKITDDVGQGKGAEKRFKRSQKGWDKILHGLEKLIEKENRE